MLEPDSLRGFKNPEPKHSAEIDDDDDDDDFDDCDDIPSEIVTTNNSI